MSQPKPHHVVTTEPAPPRPNDRRRFLVQLGLLAGAGAMALVPRVVRAPRRRRLETARPALGTWVRVVVNEPDEARAARAVGRAFAAIATVDAQMSIHRGDSQVARVNALAGRGDAAVDPAVLEVVDRAVDAARRTGGIYDPTILPLMRLYGFYDAKRQHYPSDRDVAAVLGVTGYGRVRLDRASGRLGLDTAGAALDLGSIGKGWALDRAVDALRAEGIESALVDVGGNVYGLGLPGDDEAGWSVGVAHPKTGRIDRVFTLRDTAIATSGNAEQHHALDRVFVGHLFDARRGRPADGHLSATVLARTGVESDLLSTVSFLMGPGRFRVVPGALDAHFIG
ncbi:MAG TPA: FAD:protein FMN transferase [Candidatus Eisenbacteria bacterium]